MSQEKVEELREKYAGMAMQAILSNHDSGILELFKEQAKKEQKDIRQIVARSAVELADCLIEALKK